MNPLMPIFQQLVVQELFERILFIWAIRHPASGYVQGINDLVTPFFVVFLSEFIENGEKIRKKNDSSKSKMISFFSDVEIENFDIASLAENDRKLIEADCFWTTSHLLEGIQDNYTFAQPGIQYKVRTLEDLVKRIDGLLNKRKRIHPYLFYFSIDSDRLYRHLKDQNIEFLQFAFRWMNNLLMRELPVRCTIRLWDTYLVSKLIDSKINELHMFILMFQVRTKWIFTVSSVHMCCIFGSIF